MAFRNPSAADIATLLRNARTIAVLGLSDSPSRPSYGVALGMRRFGYRIIPVNPQIRRWEGVPVIPDLDHLSEVLGPHERVDIVNVFRRPLHVDGVVDDCLRLQLPVLWLQLGVINEPAALRAQTAGMTVVMDRCIYVDRAGLV